MPEEIIVKGAREHNLKNINVRMPRGQFVVVTGLSGSGKSSLAFDTVYAEGQRRYVESLSSYARQFLGRMEKPDVDYIEGLSPAISIEQKTTHHNPRSTVGTVTEIYDYFRLLYARIGDPYCPECGKPISSQSVDQIVAEILDGGEGKAIILAPIARGEKGEFKKELDKLTKEGFVRVRIDGEIRELSEDIKLKKNIKHTIEVVIDRLIIRGNQKSRLADSVETALKYGDGLVQVQRPELEEEQLYSEKFSCPECGFSIGEIEPRLFSFNNPFGACPECTGLGMRNEFDPELVIPDKNLSLNDGAIRTISSIHGNWFLTQFTTLGDAFGFSLDTPVKKLPKKVLDVILYGSGSEEFHYVYSGKKGRSKYEFTGTYEGVIPNLSRRYKETKSDSMRRWMEQFMVQKPCQTCGGDRLKPAALSVLVGGKNIIELSRQNIKTILAFFRNLKLDKKKEHIARLVVKEILDRLGFLVDVGLDYLSLERHAGTLSGGEAQRIRLATQIGSSLTGVLYVLDEPTIGLHQRDNDRLLETLRRLQKLGNTLIVVEHDRSDYPSGGLSGRSRPWCGGNTAGEVVFQGSPEKVERCPDSLTGKYISGELSIPVPDKRRAGNGLSIEVKGAAENNLKGIDVKIPLGLFVAVTGVSGSGKSSLVNQILFKGLARELGQERLIPGKHRSFSGLENIDKVINIDQSPIGRTPRSNPATYTGLFTPIRDLFSGLPEAKARGYKAGAFFLQCQGGAL